MDARAASAKAYDNFMIPIPAVLTGEMQSWLGFESGLEP